MAVPTMIPNANGFFPGQPAFPFIPGVPPQGAFPVSQSSSPVSQPQAFQPWNIPGNMPAVPTFPQGGNLNFPPASGFSLPNPDSFSLNSSPANSFPSPPTKPDSSGSNMGFMPPTNQKPPSPEEEAAQMAALEALLKQLGAGGPSGGPGAGAGIPGSIPGMPLGLPAGQPVGSCIQQADGSIWDNGNKSSGSLFSFKNLVIAAIVAGVAVFGYKFWKNRSSGLVEAVKGTLSDASKAVENAVSSVTGTAAEVEAAAVKATT